MNGEPVVVAAGLRKRYGDLAAVDGISFEVRRGEIFGMVGPNGAGKTTTGGVPRRAAAARRRAGAAAGAGSATRNG